VRTVSPFETITTHQGITLSSLEPLPDVDESALVIVPGMPYRSTAHFDRRAIRWLARAYDAGARIASVCTGAFALGEAGLLDGRRCTTHWSRTDELAQRFPRAEVVGDCLFVTDGRITSSAGVASGIDMALAIIEEHHGARLAASVAREMVVFIRRDGEHEQTSVYLDYRQHLHPGVHRVQDWIVQNADCETSLDVLAKIGAMSRRNLTRVFRRATGITIKEYATRVRVELARTLMHDPSTSLAAVARRCGLSSRQLRRLFHEQ